MNRNDTGRDVRRSGREHKGGARRGLAGEASRGQCDKATDAKLPRP